jgi:hypothetical protein
MIIAVQQIDKEIGDVEFKRLYLCSRIDIIKELEEGYLDDFLSYDNGIDADINDPFLLSYIYAN